MMTKKKIMHNPQLLIAVRHISNNIYALSLESLVTITIQRKCPAISLLVVQSPNDDKLSSNDIQLDFELNNIAYEICTTPPQSITKYCKWPIVFMDNNYVISGLCSVCRFLIKSNRHFKNLLGFRDTCLNAPAHMSVWTKFCEIDLIASIKSVITNPSNDILQLPKDLIRYEHHLKQPVKLHNINKVRRDVSNFKLERTFCEGIHMSLTDIMIYLILHTFFAVYRIHYSIFANFIPLIVQWFQTVCLEMPFIPLQLHFQNIYIISKIDVPKVDQNLKFESTAKYFNNVEKQMNPSICIKNSLRAIEKSSLNCSNSLKVFASNTNTFNWDHIPEIARPLGGGLPANRSDRKLHQLSNMLNALLHILRKPQSVIVDFCSGAGHLGIVIAWLLPESTVILVDNKEHSLSIAQKRINELQLNNIMIIQSNINQFLGPFDIGITLHACGLATDLVIKICIEHSADFICCPCCYGALNNIEEEHNSYPKSKQFQKVLNSNEYLVLARGADQTHNSDNIKTVQGFLCMDIIDTDRKLFIENYGYKVDLGKLQPTSCTNKNNILVATLLNT